MDEIKKQQTRNSLQMCAKNINQSIDCSRDVSKSLVNAKNNFYWMDFRSSKSIGDSISRFNTNTHTNLMDLKRTISDAANRLY